MTKDRIGNRLNEGHFVEVMLPHGTSALRGRIKTINEVRIQRIGGSSAGKGNASVQPFQPGLVTVEILLPIEVDPSSEVMPNVIRIWDPTGKDLESAEVEGVPV